MRVAISAYVDLPGTTPGTVGTVAGSSRVLAKGEPFRPSESIMVSCEGEGPAANDKCPDCGHAPGDRPSPGPDKGVSLKSAWAFLAKYLSILQPYLAEYGGLILRTVEADLLAGKTDPTAILADVLHALVDAGVHDLS